MRRRVIQDVPRTDEVMSAPHDTWHWQDRIVRGRLDSRKKSPCYIINE